MIHEMKLNHQPFVQIKNKKKTIELRLNDEKRQLLNIGDFILFTDRLDFSTLTVKILNLHYAKNFDELFTMFTPIMLGYEKGEIPNPKDMEQYYTQEEQAKYGVVGIEIQLMEE